MKNPAFNNKQGFYQDWGGYQEEDGQQRYQEEDGQQYHEEDCYQQYHEENGQQHQEDGQQQYPWGLSQQQVNQAVPWNQFSSSFEMAPQLQLPHQNNHSSRCEEIVREPVQVQPWNQFSSGFDVAPQSQSLLWNNLSSREQGVGENAGNRWLCQQSSYQYRSVVNLPVNQMIQVGMVQQADTPCGVVFQCDDTNEQECMENGLFGLPKLHKPLVERIQPGIPLFLFNFRSRAMHGIFEATSQGSMNLNPYAFGNGQNGSLYPCQVYVRRVEICEPIFEQEFCQILQENYIAEGCFHYELTSRQVEGIIHLMKAQGESLQWWRFPSNKRGRSNNNHRNFQDKRQKQMGSFQLEWKQSRYNLQCHDDNKYQSRKCGRQNKNRNFRFERGGRQNENNRKQSKKRDYQKHNQNNNNNNNNNNNINNMVSLGSIIAGNEERTSVSIRNFPKRVRIWDVLKILYSIVPDQLDFFLATPIRNEPDEIRVYVNLSSPKLVLTLFEAIVHYDFDDLSDAYIRYGYNLKIQKRILYQKKKRNGGLKVFFNKIQGLSQIKDFYGDRLKFWEGSPLAAPDLQLNQPMIFVDAIPYERFNEEWGDIANVQTQAQDQETQNGTQNLQSQQTVQDEQQFVKNEQNDQNTANLQVKFVNDKYQEQFEKCQESSKQQVFIDQGGDHDENVTDRSQLYEKLKQLNEEHASWRKKLRDSQLSYTSKNDIKKYLEKLEKAIILIEGQLRLEGEEYTLREEGELFEKATNFPEPNSMLKVTSCGGENKNYVQVTPFAEDDKKEVTPSAGDKNKDEVELEQGEISIQNDSQNPQVTDLVEDFIQLE